MGIRVGDHLERTEQAGLNGFLDQTSAIRFTPRDPWSSLRLAVTDACNYACAFCHNEGNIPSSLARATTMSIEMATFLARAAAKTGFAKIKLTGGEPLTFRRDGKDITFLTRSLRQVVGDRKLSITTNGQLLARYASPLADSGLDYVTVSIHTLDERTFASEISRTGSPAAQLRGIRAAREAGLRVKANIVVLPDTVSEVPTLARQLFDCGAHTIRLYRPLWSPFAASKVEGSKVTESVLAHLAADCSGSEPRHAIEKSVLSALNLGHIPGTVELSGSLGHIEVDRLQNVTDTAMAEGDYAIRVGPDGWLRAHLYSLDSNLNQAINDGSIETVCGAFRKAQEALRG